MIYKKLLTCILLLLLRNTCFGLNQDNQTWGNLTSIGDVCLEDKDKCFKIWLEGQLRFGDSSTRLSQSLLRTGLGYELTEYTSLWVGYAWINTRNPFTTNPFDENRIWQQLLWINSFKKIKVQSRLRTEQRFIARTRNTAFRVREMVKIMVPFRYHEAWSTLISDEVFWHANDYMVNNAGRGFDQNRFFLGLGYNITPAIIAEVGYMNQYIRRFGTPNFKNNIASLNLNINW